MTPIVPGPWSELSLEEQEELLDENLDDGFRWLRSFLADSTRMSVVARLARDRHRRGVQAFADSGWKKHPDELTREMLEELADFLVYAAMRRHRRSGGPGSH